MAMAAPLELFDGVVVVGGGLAGCSAAYHLTKAGFRVLLLEAGIVGWGDSDAQVEISAVSDQQCEHDWKIGVSGTAGVGLVKMVVTQPPISISDFVKQHGEAGARSYLHMSSSGVELQRRLASELAPQTLRNQGSICVAFPSHKKQLREDYLVYKRLQCDVRLLGRSEVERYHGSKAGFVAGLQFPRDCIVHSAEYARALLRQAHHSGLLTLRERCPRVCHVDDTVAASAAAAVLRLADGSSIRARHAVLATGGLYMPDDLRGILRPCWSYFSYMPPQKDSPPLPQPNSPNFFTFDFSHDWCVTDGEVRISGEDHYSAFKPPLWRERCEKLAGWLRHRYPGLREAPLVRTHYGIYSDTPDALPIVGRRSSGSAVTYLLGCNAWGQSILSYCASLVPALVGVQDLATLPEDDRRLLKLISAARFTAKSRL